MNMIHLETSPKLNVKTKATPQIRTEDLTFTATALSIINLAVHNSLFSLISTISLGILVSLGVLSLNTNWLNDPRLKKFINKRGVLPICFLAFFFGIYLYFALDPVHAQFFFPAEQSINQGVATAMAGTQGTTIADTQKIISLIFLLLRIMLVVYLGVSLVKVVGAMREDEDYKALARTPLIILITLTVGDFISALIMGTGTAAP